MKVIAAKGRVVPISTRVATGPGGKMIFVGDANAVELPDVSFVRRRINAGDLVEVAIATTSAPPAVAPAPVTAPAATPTKER
jgi:hypothetical protein